jgi:hypothetical protein
VSLPSIDRFKYPFAIDRHSQHNIFLSRDSSEGIAYVALLLVGRKLSVEVHVRRPSGVWGQGILAAVDLPVISNAAFDITMPVHGKLYMVTTQTVWILFSENEK